MSDSVGKVLGTKVPVVINGKEYMIPPIDLGILADAEAEIIKGMIPLSEETKAIAHIAAYDRDLAKELFDKAIARRESVPAEEVLGWICRDLKGVAFSMYRQLLSAYPGEFANQTLTRDMVYKNIYMMAQTRMLEYQEMVRNRNVKSELEEPPVNPT